MFAPVPLLNGGLRRHSGSPLASEDDGLGAGVTNSVHAQAHSHTSHKLLGGEKIAGSAMNRLGASEANPKGAYQG